MLRLGQRSASASGCSLSIWVFSQEVTGEQSRRRTDGQRDRRTDGQTDGDMTALIQTAEVKKEPTSTIQLLSRQERSQNRNTGWVSNRNGFKTLRYCGRNTITQLWCFHSIRNNKNHTSVNQISATRQLGVLHLKITKIKTL